MASFSIKKSQIETERQGEFSQFGNKRQGKKEGKNPDSGLNGRVKKEGKSSRRELIGYVLPQKELFP